MAHRFARTARTLLPQNARLAALAVATAVFGVWLGFDRSTSSATQVDSTFAAPESSEPFAHDPVYPRLPERQVTIASVATEASVRPRRARIPMPRPTDRRDEPQAPVPSAERPKTLPPPVATEATPRVSRAESQAPVLAHASIPEPLVPLVSARAFPANPLRTTPSLPRPDPAPPERAPDPVDIPRKPMPTVMLSKAVPVAMASKPVAIAIARLPARDIDPREFVAPALPPAPGRVELPAPAVSPSAGGGAMTPTFLAADPARPLAPRRGVPGAITPVPEPSTATLLAMGLALLAWRARRPGGASAA